MSSGETSRGNGGNGGAGRLLAGRYRVLAQLGRGGMGVVWRAVDEVLGREVAVKELRTYTDADGPELADLRLRMQREARAAARVRHPGVVAVHDIGEVDGRPLIVMELVDGPSLDDVLRERGTLDPSEAAGIGARVMDALAAAHQVGVLHRDVKPGNILLDRSGRVVLTDFGIATMEDPGDGSATHLTRSGELVGSLDYLAPERAQGADPGPASDVWALGATLYAAVEGSSPFRRTSTYSTLAAIVTEPLPEPRHAGPLASVLQRLLDKRPEARPEAEKARALLQAVADLGGRDTPTRTLRGAAAPTTETERGVPPVPPGFGPVGTEGPGSAPPGQAATGPSGPGAPGAAGPRPSDPGAAQQAGTEAPGSGSDGRPGPVFPVFGTPEPAERSTGHPTGGSGPAERAPQGSGAAGQSADGSGSAAGGVQGFGAARQVAGGSGSAAGAVQGSGSAGRAVQGSGAAADGSGSAGRAVQGFGPPGQAADGSGAGGQAAPRVGAAEHAPPASPGFGATEPSGQVAPGYGGPGQVSPGVGHPGRAVPGSGPPPPADSASAPTGPITSTLPTRRKGRFLLAAAAVGVVLVAAGTTVALVNNSGGTHTEARSAGAGTGTTASASASGRTDADHSGRPRPTEQGGKKRPTATRNAGRKGGGAPTNRTTSSAPTKSSGGGTTGGGTTGHGSGNGGTTGGAGGGTATPTPSCTSMGGGKYDCTVWRDAKSYTASGTEAGVLHAGVNYFYCQQNLGRRETYGQWTNVWWAKTDDDSGNTNVYISDVYIRGGDNDEPVPGLPVC